MDRNEFEGKWKQIRSRVKHWRSLITNSYLTNVDLADVSFFEYATILQLKHALDRQSVKARVDGHMVAYEFSLKPITVWVR